MKTKHSNHHERPFHLNLEYMFRHQYFLLGMLAFMMFAVLKTDSRVLSLMRDAYAHGFGIVGQYMREETTRMPVTFEVSGRLPTISGK
jgi:hypothetical protein